MPLTQIPRGLLGAGCGWPLRSSVGKASRRKQDNTMSGCLQKGRLGEPDGKAGPLVARLKGQLGTFPEDSL